MCPVYLRKNVSCVDKEYLVLLGSLLVEEPKCGWQGYSREHIAGQGYHLTDDAVFYELLAYLQFAAARIAGRVRHYEGCLAVAVECGGKIAYPQIVGIGYGFLFVGGFSGRFGFVARHSVGVEAFVVGYFVYHYLVYVERWVRHNIVELSESIVRVAVERVGFCNFAAHVVQQKVHLCELYGVWFFLYAIATEVHYLFVGGVMVVHIACCLNEHTARTAGWVEEFLVASGGLQHLHHVLYNAGWRIERTATLPLCECKIAEEVFVYLPENVDADVLWNVFKHPDDSA